MYELTSWIPKKVGPSVAFSYTIRYMTKESSIRVKGFAAECILTAVAGLAYNSWPLGYVLNPAVTRTKGLASELEGLHQPFNWVFIALDIFCGVCVAAACAIMISQRMPRASKMTVASFALFGLLTMADAVLPMSCEPSLTTCPTLSHQPILILHGVASIGSGISLFTSAALMWYQIRKGTGRSIMSILMLGWVVSGVLTLYFFFLPGPGYLAQDYYLVLCGAWIALVPHMLIKARHYRPEER